jgi:hypothetical protein
MELENKSGFSLTGVGLIVTGLVALVAFLAIFGTTTIQGNQAGVKEDWNNGVLPDALGPKMYMYNRVTTDIFAYDMSGQVFVMNSKSVKDENFADGRAFDPIEIVANDKQKVVFNITIQWRRDFKKLIEMHKAYRDQVEERLIRPRVIEAFRANATIIDAIDLYSGATLEATRKKIESDLKSATGALLQGGVIVDSFIIDRVELPDAQYVANIEARQRAFIAESRAKAEEKANEAIAKAAQAAALKAQYETLVQVETASKKTIIDQQAQAEKLTIEAKAKAYNDVVAAEAAAKVQIVDAEASAKKQVLASDALKVAELNRAIGIEAVGRAEAEAKKLTYIAYAGAGGDNYTRIQVAEAYAKANNTVRFFPSNATYNTIASDFNKGLNLLVGQPDAASTFNSSTK